MTPDQALASFELEPGYRIELAAAEPLIRDPVAIAFDERGRMYVAESRGYPGPLEGAPGSAPEGVIALLEDTDHDGRFDKRTDFARNLTFPNGIMPWDGGVFVTCAPDLLYLKDTTGDGIADERTGRADRFRRDEDRPDAIQPPDARDRQLDLSDQRTDRRSRDRTGSSRAPAGGLRQQRLTLQPDHACVRADRRPGPGTA